MLCGSGLIKLPKNGNSQVENVKQNKTENQAKKQTEETNKNANNNKRLNQPSIHGSDTQEYACRW